jgi:hypothetical protein
MRPATVSQWLLGSLCWTVIGVGSWWELTTGLLAEQPGDSGVISSLLLAGLLQGLLWWQAVGNARKLLLQRPVAWLQLAGWGWYTLLHVALLLALGLTVFYGLLFMAFSGGGPWFG